MPAGIPHSSLSKAEPAHPSKEGMHNITFAKKTVSAELQIF